MCLALRTGVIEEWCLGEGGQIFRKNEGVGLVGGGQTPYTMHPILILQTEAS